MAGVTTCLAQVYVNGAQVASQGETAILQKMNQYPWWQTIASATIAALLAIGLSEGLKYLIRRSLAKEGGQQPRKSATGQRSEPALGAAKRKPSKH